MAGETTVSPEDPRHGKLAGYRAGCHEGCCRKAANDRNQRLKLSGEYGRRLVDPTGTKRRVQALAALGWSHAAVSQRIGRSPTFLAQTIRTRPKVSVDTAALVRKVYDDLSMRLPPTETVADRMSVVRTRRLAKRNGWLPPLMWDDERIDDPTYTPLAPKPKVPAWDEVDEAVVLRVLAGERLPTTRAEKEQILTRWLAAGKSGRELARIQGWREGRYSASEAS